MESIEWAYDDIGEITSKGQLNNMADFLAHKQLDLVINLPMRHGGARRVSSFSTHGKVFSSGSITCVSVIFYFFFGLVLKVTLTHNNLSILIILCHLPYHYTAFTQNT